MNTPPPRRRPYMSAQRREAQRIRILALVKGGLSYDLIASQEEISRSRVRQIVIDAMQRDPGAMNIDSGRVHAALLAPALALAEQAIARGKLSGIDRFLKVLDLLDKIRPQPEDFDPVALEKLRRRLNLDGAPAPEGDGRPPRPSTH